MAERSPPVVRNAEKNNDRLFPVLQRNLASDDPLEYAAAAEKLAGWMRRDKAYYPKARPIIVGLIETALETVRRRSTPSGAPFHISRCTADVRPWAEPYIKLVRTVVPFILLFPEHHLQLRLRALIQTICDNVEGFLSQQTLHPPTNVSSPVSSLTGTPRTPLSPVETHYSPTTTPHPSLPRQTPPVPAQGVAGNPPQVSNRLTEEQKRAVLALATARTISPLTMPPPAPPPVPPATAPPTVPVAASAPATPAQPTVPVATPFVVWPPPSASARIDNKRTVSVGDLPISTPAPPASPSPVQIANSTAAAGATMSSDHARHKAKRRKTVPIDMDFIEADLDWYKDKRSAEATSGQQDKSSTTANTATSTLSLVAVTASPASAPSTAPEDGPRSADPATTVHIEQIAPAVTPAGNTPSVTSRSPSIPLRDLVHLSSTSAHPSHTPGDSGPKSSTEPPPQPAPQSPTILGPSITRRPADVPAPGAATADAEQASSSKVSSPPTEQKLPSPLASKNFKKRKRGPPGFKFLPILTPEGPAPDPMFVDELKDDVSTSTRESSTTAAPASVPAPSQAAEAPAPTEEARSDAHQTTAPARILDDTAATVGSPAPMDVDMDIPSRSVDVASASGDAAASSHEQRGMAEDAEMRDLPSAVAGVEDALATTLASSPDEAVAATPRTPLFLPSSSESSVVNMSVIHPAEGEHEASAPPPVTAASTNLGEQPTTTELVNGHAKTDDQADNSSPFIYASARVLSIARGSSSMTPANEPVVLEFELSADELAQVARWKGRSSTAEDLSQSLCVSFVSYLVSQCVEENCDTSSPNTDGMSDITKCGRPAPWPQDGTAFVLLNDGEGPDRFSISPPFITTVDKCVDLGTRNLRAGTNTLHLFQYRDHSDRVFAVLLHHPTRAQLSELQAVRAKENEWRQFLDGLGRIELRVPRLFPSSVVTNVVSHS
ncbi:hypothetical protein OH77DRAFT_1419106 [Trametes cingulata]|nr:hypothetical protein OH77DRAFT_1419106 [Trametes cingulata]